jgi:uncharacterized repeat protein (TIGR01451 family)
MTRPADLPGVPNTADGCDIGAYEYQVQPVDFWGLMKTVDDELPIAGQRITYTVSVRNVGESSATEGVISDTMPGGITFAGPVSLDPPEAGTTGRPPTLISGLSILPGQSITVTFPVTVDLGVPQNTVITNTAAISSSEVPGPLVVSAAIVIGDSTPPGVASTVPRDGGMIVNLANPVVITFSEAISTATFAYTVTPDPGGWTEEWDASDTAVELDHSAFVTSTTYSVSITAADDLAGLPLAEAPYTWEFNTPSQWLFLPLVARSTP